MIKEVLKKVNLNIDEFGKNYFVLLTAFKKAAKRDGWSFGEISSVIYEAVSKDYFHLVTTISKYCK